MFNKKPATAQLSAPETVIGKGVFIEAVKMTGKESVRIDGNFTGLIDIDGSLILSDTSHVTGDVKAKYILAAGNVKGNILCDTVLHMASTAKIIGDVRTQTLIADEGCQVEGRYHVGKFDTETISASDIAAERSGEKSYLDKSIEITENSKSK